MLTCKTLNYVLKQVYYGQKQNFFQKLVACNGKRELKPKYFVSFQHQDSIILYINNSKSAKLSIMISMLQLKLTKQMNIIQSNARHPVYKLIAINHISK